MDRLRIIYDGACPFCSQYVRLVRLRKNYDVELVDARSQAQLIRHYADLGMDLNDGMVVEFDGEIWYGADAIWFLSTLSSRLGLWNRFLARLFASRFRSRLLYPAMRFGRRVTLSLLGRQPLH